MFIKSDIDENYISEFNKLGIADIDIMLTILNSLDMLAEIGYTVYIDKE